MEDDERLSRQVTIDERLLGAKAETPHDGKLNLRPLCLDRVFQAFVHFFRAVSDTTGSHPYRYLGNIGEKFLHSVLSDGFERHSIEDLHGFFLPLETFDKSFCSLPVVMLL